MIEITFTRRVQSSKWYRYRRVWRSFRSSSTEFHEQPFRCETRLQKKVFFFFGVRFPSSFNFNEKFLFFGGRRGGGGVFIYLFRSALIQLRRFFFFFFLRKMKIYNDVNFGTRKSHPLIGAIILLNPFCDFSPPPPVRVIPFRQTCINLTRRR